MSKKVLMILTSHDRMGDSGKPTGIWSDELAVPYYGFRDAGIDVVLASPRGGVVPFDPNSLKPAGENDAEVDRMLADPVAQAAIRNTVPVASVNAADFDAVFFAGGHGTMWDLPGDAGVTRAVESAWGAGKVVAAVCHGPAGLISAKDPDGKSILNGRRVSGFTDSEENAVGLTSVVPFALETRMRELGGLFEHGPDWQPFAVTDGKLVTGQNPASSGLVAEKVLGLLQAG
ncbi:type 1 glutamine amidotransferase domain-containing protein [Uliginosibacterium sp. H1]|uniref:type 1 glutamine amidotransferase domain-containing protein n=1 Tax=Uliginosibacterium sp. H1 TaxID=3114757 RepID=UPI002E186A58|nr:type 1 glutamine amidotransferase domain-containing protein [Uliginosibacterium sp. H1]